MVGTIDIRSDKQYKKLKREYVRALETLGEKKDRFDFEGNILLVKFAKYLLQYIENTRNSMGLSIYNSKGTKVGKFDDNYKSKDEVWK